MNDKQHASNKFNIKVLIKITSAGFIAGMYRNGMMSLFPFLQSHFDLSKAQIGLYSTFLYISMAIVVIFAGRIADYFGAKKSIFWGLLTMGIFIILHCLVQGFLLLMLLATLSGLGLSIILPSTSKAVAEWFEGDNQATAMGIMTMGFALGGVIGASFLPWFGVNFGWKRSVILLGTLFLLVSFLFYYFYEEKEINTKIKENKESEKNNIKDNLKLFLTNKYILVVCIVGIMFGVLSGSIVSHFTLFLFTDFNFSEVAAGFGFMILQIGSMVGRTSWGYINNKLFDGVERKGFLMVGIISSLMTLIFAFLKTLNPSIVIILFLAFLLGALGRGWHGLYFATISKQVGEDKAGMGIGLSLLFVRFGIIIGPPIFGYIADRTGTYTYSWLLLSITTTVVILISYYFLNKFRKGEKSLKM